MAVAEADLQRVRADFPDVYDLHIRSRHDCPGGALGGSTTRATTSRTQRPGAEHTAPIRAMQVQLTRD